MSLTAGTITVSAVQSNTAQLVSTAATMGTAPYTYQWYRSTTNSFSPGAGSLLSGATSLSLSDSGLIPNTVYYYVIKVTDSASPAATANSSQASLTTLPSSLSQNQFAQAPVVGQVDLPYNYNTKSVIISSSYNGTAYQGMAVKLVPGTSGGAPIVTPCTASTDEVFGFINYNVKNVGYVAGNAAQVSQSGNVIWLYATAAITQGARVCLDVSAAASVQPTGASPAADVVGWALDGASAAGQLIRVNLTCPSFLTA